MRWSRPFHGLLTDNTKKTATSMHSEMAVIFNVVFSVLRWGVPREHPYDRSLHISQQCKSAAIITSYFNAVSVTPASFNLASVSSSVCVRISAYSLTVSWPAFFKSATESSPILSAVRSVMIAS